ncbi:MAG: DUF1153 domain-containing protein [Sphingomonadaceae bacterium]|nr:DUF1153 domain-containing protein [Sphingomonadaceae bacterium]
MSDARTLSIADRIKSAGLPRSYDVHWSAQRKEEVVRAVREQLITFDEARWRYLLSRREFDEWERDVDRKTSTNPAAKSREMETA